MVEPIRKLFAENHLGRFNLIKHQLSVKQLLKPRHPCLNQESFISEME